MQIHQFDPRLIETLEICVMSQGFARNRGHNLAQMTSVTGPKEGSKKNSQKAFRILGITTQRL